MVVCDFRSVLSPPSTNFLPVGVLVYHIHEQNASIVIRKGLEFTLFEAFEVLAPTSAVIGCTGKLIRVLPGPAVQVPNKVVGEEGFLEQVATTLSSMDSEHFGDAITTSKKANSEHWETRDSAHPKLITELFMGILRGYGQSARVKLVKKRTADEVLWKDALKPWRRSRAWFVIRVLLHLSVKEDLHYKIFMIYFLKDIMNLGTTKALDSDLLYVARAKMARRAQKLGSSIPPHIIGAALDAACRCENLLQLRWTKVQAGWQTRQSIPWDPITLDIQTDTRPTLPNCRRPLRCMFMQQSNLGTVDVLDVKDRPTHQYADFVMYSSGCLEAFLEETGRTAMYDFERSVLVHLSQWTDNEIAADHHIEAATILESCFRQYHMLFKRVYNIDVVDRSLAVLTLLQLWVAIDRISVVYIPLLSQFSPELHEGLLRRLLIKDQVELEALHRIEIWIRRRQRNVFTVASVFAKNPGPSSFTTRFFDSSLIMKSLRDRIENDAKVARAEKLVELHKLNREYTQLVEALGSTTEHDDIINRHSPRQEHWKQRCSRCKLERKLANLKIAVHEWPLPSDKFKAQMVVFELAIPEVFSCWRDVTYTIMHDIASVEPIGLPLPEMSLNKDKHLQPYRSAAASTQTSRIALASSAKPVIKSHYATRPLPAVEADVVSDNGLDYRLYDGSHATWVPSSFESASFVPYGTQAVSSKSAYAYLQYSISWTSHSTNQVIADRSNCSPQISLQEHDSFGSLRSGARYGLF
jgi:hypothetical protein